MSFTKELRSWFFRTGAPTNTEGKKINLENGSRPDQDVFEKLSASHLNFSEAGDRAKINTGAAIETEVGTVAVTSDAKAKAGTSGLEIDRTLVVHASQLPTPEANSETIDDFTGDALEITVDLATSTRNNYFFNLSATFSAWLLSRLVPGGGTAGQVLDKVDGDDYNVQWSTPTSTASLITEDEGIEANAVTTTIDFIGDGVQAVDAGGNKTEVTITQSADTNTIPVWSSLDGDAIELYYGGGDVPSAGLSAVIVNWDDTGGTLQSFLNYYIMDKVIHFVFRFDFTVDFTPALVGNEQVVVRVGISPPSGETFVPAKGGMCLNPDGKVIVTGVNIGYFDGTDIPLITSHVAGEKIYFNASKEIKSSETIKFTGEFTAQLA
jgi:hypothetical protein